MADPFRNIRRQWHLSLGTRRYDHWGVALNTGPDDLPESVRSHIFKGGYEAVEAELVSDIVRPGDRVLEVGTGIGFVSILCTKLAGQGRVTSYEANPKLEPTIRANYALNALQPDLRMKAVTVDGTQISFFANDNILSSSLIDRNLSATEITVETDAMADVMAEVQPDVIVMDVEGAETELLPAADLSGVRALIIEVHPHIIGAEAIERMDFALADQGFLPTQTRHKTVLYARAGS